MKNHKKKSRQKIKLSKLSKFRQENGLKQTMVKMEHIAPKHCQIKRKTTR